jgi:hypothetical protein
MRLQSNSRPFLAIVALDKQKALLEEYKSHLLRWRTAIASQYRQVWKKLVVRLLIVALIVGLLFGIAGSRVG